MPKIFVIACATVLYLSLFQRTVLAQSPFALFASPTSEANEVENEEIETDRDSFTPSTKIVGRRVTIVETSYSYIDNNNVPGTHSLPELLVRHGISKYFELRFGYNYEVGGAGSPVSGNVPDDFEEGADIEDESRISYGTKLFFSKQESLIPESSIILQGYTPTSGAETSTDFAVAYIFGWKLPKGTLWDSGFRYSTGVSEVDHFNVWSPSTVIKIPIGERWKAHAEYFGVFTDGRENESTQHFFSPGIHYLCTKDIEIGIRTGWGLNEQTPQFFSNIGFGIQF